MFPLSPNVAFFRQVIVKERSIHTLIEIFKITPSYLAGATVNPPKLIKGVSGEHSGSLYASTLGLVGSCSGPTIVWSTAGLTLASTIFSIRVAICRHYCCVEDSRVTEGTQSK